MVMMVHPYATQCTDQGNGGSIMISRSPPTAEATPRSVRNPEALPCLHQCGRQLPSTSYAAALRNEGCQPNGVGCIRSTKHKCSQ
jgi:hypothetical protein